jgi:hypothetical protein
MIRFAQFNTSKTRRYWLLRAWDELKPTVMFIGLNPSTADENQDDPTIKNVIKIAMVNGFGSVYMLNLFTYVTSKPHELILDTIHQENNAWLIDTAKRCDRIVFCWGNFAVAEKRSREVIAMFSEAYCLKRNKNGSPKHPLYCKSTSILIPYGK